MLMPILLSRLKDTHKAHATAPALTACISVVSAAFYILNGNMNAEMTAYGSIGATAGGIVGAWLMPKIKAKTLGKIFAVLMMVAALRMMK